ncbi:MAG: hypothetical protein CM1200mP20_11070 [Pseudomonadota bacterium]|nr:MAG: hypothetical protein CM1200mP20_11070 [Pseudomonadota bacterium]
MRTLILASLRHRNIGLDQVSFQVGWHSFVDHREFERIERPLVDLLPDPDQ